MCQEMFFYNFADGN